MGSEKYLISLVHELCKLPKETEWVEFKHNNSRKEDIGEYLSALSNSAALLGKTSAYVIWGVEDGSNEILGTTFNPITQKVGNEELENWLLQRLNPKLHFQFRQVEVEPNKTVVILEIPAASKHPTSFQHEELIRVGSYRKKLKNFPEKERELWRALEQIPFESQFAVERIPETKVLELLDYPSYFEMLNLPLPDGRRPILDALIKDDLIELDDAGQYAITNLGAVLFARNLDDFTSLKRKAVRVIQYEGDNKIKTLREYIERDYMTNASLRKRFGIEEKNTAMVSRIINDALKSELICIYDESVGARARKYIPAWARH